MLVEFQQALADLTASPDLCIAVRAMPDLLQARYRLTQREWRRLVGIVNHPGMACNCMLYRANRLAPIAMHLPRLCKALGKDLKALASAYWAAFPDTNVHAFVEAARFAQFVTARMDGGQVLGPGSREAIAEEATLLSLALAQSHTEGRA
jgi:hypothetical protein